MASLRRATESVLLVCLVALANEASAGTASFGYRKSLTIDHLQVAGIADHVDFPVLISLVDLDLRTIGNGGRVQSPSGHDLVFVAPDGTTRLDFEIETYDGATGTLVAWVRMPILFVASNSLFYVHYGSSEVVTPQETPSSTWRAGYAGVWHLDEQGLGQPGEYQDSSSFGNAGIAGNGSAAHSPARVAGQIGFGQYFDRVYARGDASLAAATTTVTFANCSGCLPANVQAGDTLVLDPGGGNEETFTVLARLSATQLTVTAPAVSNHAAETYLLYEEDPNSDMVNVGDDPSLSVFSDQITLQAWLQHDITPDFSQSFGILNHKGFDDGYRLLLADNSRRLRFDLPGSSDPLTSAATLTNNAWHHVAATYDGTTMRIYIDGVADANTRAKTGNVAPAAPRQNDVWLGHGDQPVDKSWSYPWQGFLDEVRISRVARSADWIATEFANQSSPGTFYSVGVEEPGSYSLATHDVNLRSIGTGGQLYATGQATVVAGSRTVSFTGGSLPATIGAGDKLVLDPLGPNEETLFVLTRDTATELTLQTRAVLSHAADSFSIDRAFGTLQAWEDARQGNLVAENRREIGMVYDDGDLTSPLIIDGSTTDSTRFLSLTVAPGHRHSGVAGTGAILRPSVATHPIYVRDDYTRVEWLEITGWPSSGHGILIDADHCLFRHLIVHDGGGLSADGLQLQENSSHWTATIENTIVYNMGRTCYFIDNGLGTRSLFLKLENVTAYNCGWGGGDAAGGVSFCETSGNESKIYARNVLSVGNANKDFNAIVSAGCDGTPSWTTSDANVSSDGTAPGPNSFTLASAANQFASVALGAEDLHLKPGADALDAGEIALRIVDDIDGRLRQETLLWDVGADELEATTAVELVRLEAESMPGGVVVWWETASELDNLGFHLHRASSPGGPYHSVSPQRIAGLGSSPEGGRYRFEDRGLEPGDTYYYELEDVDARGALTRHGPVSAVAGAPTEDQPGPYAGWTFGEPEEAKLVVSRPDADTAVIVLETPGFSVRIEEGAPTLHLPGFDAAMPPVRRASIEALPGREVRILSIEAQEVIRFPAIGATASTSEAIGSAAGTTRLVKRRTRARSEAWAQLGEVGYQGDRKKALLTLHPFRWEEGSSELLLARRIVVRISFQGPDRAERPLGSRRGRRRAAVAPDGRAVLRLVAREPGLYAVDYEELFGRTSVPAVKLSRQGEAVPFHVEPGGGSFRPGTRLFFVSEGEALNPYGREAVYEVEIASGEAIPVGAGAEGRHEVPYLLHRMEREEDRYYQAGLLSAPDRWLWAPLPSGTRSTYGFVTTGLARGPSSGRLTLRFQGTSDLREDPDHHLRVRLNGAPVGETFWNGKTPNEVAVELPPGTLGEGLNEIEIENAGDTGAAYSLVMLDGFEVLYPRFPEADRGLYSGVSPERGIVTVGGFADGAFVVDTTNRTWIPAERLERGVRFAVEAGRHYLAAAPGRVLRPEIRRASPTGLRHWKTPADLLAVVPRELSSALTPLLERRRAQGLAVREVSVEEAYDELGFGEATPEAIRRLVSTAYHDGGVRYVLLVGDGTYDFKDRLGTGKRNLLPPLLVQTAYLWTASDPSYAAVNGEDMLPDVAIGRLPAASPDELRSMVEKILFYEDDPSELLERVVLVADDRDGAGDFRAEAEELATVFFAGGSASRIFLDELGPERTRGSVRDAFDAGASLVSYLGHGGIHLWADENLLDLEAIDALVPQSRRPLLLTMNCLNGYFHFPYFDSLAERMVKVEGRGAVAAFSPSGLSWNASAARFQRDLLAELLQGGHQRLGDAVLAAQERYVDSGFPPELVRIYHLLGDPSLLLPR